MVENLQIFRYRKLAAVNTTNTPTAAKMYVIFFSLIWVYATSFSFGSKLNLFRFMAGCFTSKGKSSKGYNILFTSSMKRTFCDANKVRLRIIDRTIWRFEFGFSFWVLIRLITFLRGGEVHWREKSITTNYLQEEEEALNELPRKYLQNINNISNKSK